MRTDTHQEGTKHIEADEIKDSKTAPTGMFTFNRVVWFKRFRITSLIWKACQHDFLPSFTSSTSVERGLMRKKVRSSLPVT